MLFGESGRDKRIVEAIEEGKIVKVSEDYARREDLPILRRNTFVENRNLPSGLKNPEEEGPSYGIDSLRKPLRWRDNKIVKDLVENFHWHISKARRARGLSRKQFAEAVGESENSIKMIENGILPRDDFVLVNKVQEFLGISLRKETSALSQPIRKELESSEHKELNDGIDILGDDIEIIEGA